MRPSQPGRGWMHLRVSLQVCPDQTETKLASTQQNGAQMCHK